MHTYMFTGFTVSLSLDRRYVHYHEMFIAHITYVRTYRYVLTAYIVHRM